MKSTCFASLLTPALLLLPAASAPAYPFAAPQMIKADTPGNPQMIRAVADLNNDGREYFP